jgi:NitT/TauT family transport system permease protein
MSTYTSDVRKLSIPDDATLLKRRSRRQEQERWFLLLMRLGGVAIVLVFWEIAVRTGIARELIFGQPSRIFGFLIQMLEGGDLLKDTAVTAYETVLGYVFGVGLGCATGFAMWWFPRLGKVFDPYMTAINSIPKVALAPIFLVWFGLGIGTKIMLSFVTVYIVMHMTIYSGLREVESDLVDLARSFGARRGQVFWKVVVPSSMPWILSGMNVSIGFALTGAIIGEYVAANQGLGYLTLYAAQLYEMSLVWAAIVVLVVMSVFFYAAVVALQRWLTPWYSE